MRPLRVPGPGLDLDLDQSQNKPMLQNLNGRLSCYLQQVRCLESSNQALEQQIEAELHRRSPGDKTHLKNQETSNDLRDQISVCVWECALLKLHCLGTELTATDYESRCAAVRTERQQVEAELTDLKLLWAELQERHLTDLNQEVCAKEAELRGLKAQHHQDVQRLLSQDLGVSVQLQTQPSFPDVSLQLQTASEPTLTWSLHTAAGGARVSEDAEQLRTTASNLQKELEQLRQQNFSLEASALDHMGALELLLAQSQLRASRLCNELQTTLEEEEDLRERHKSERRIVESLREELWRYRELLQEPQGDHSGLSPNLKWTGPVIQVSAPKSSRSIYAGQRVQNHSGFDQAPKRVTINPQVKVQTPSPGTSKEPFTTTSEETTTGVSVLTEIKSSPRLVQNHMESPKLWKFEAITPRQKVTSTSRGNAVISQKQETFKEIWKVSNEDGSKVTRSEDVGSDESLPKATDANAKDDNATDAKATDAKATDSDATEASVRLVSIQGKMRHTESTTIVCVPQTASQTLREDAANPKTEKEQICRQVVDSKPDVCPQNGTHRETISNTNIHKEDISKLENRPETISTEDKNRIKAEVSTKVSQEVTYLAVDRHISEVKAAEAQKYQAKELTKTGKTLRNESQIIPKTSEISKNEAEIGEDVSEVRLKSDICLQNGFHRETISNTNICKEDVYELENGTKTKSIEDENIIKEDISTKVFQEFTTFTHLSQKYETEAGETAPEAETTDALTAPEAEITDALTPPEAEITDALTAPEAETTDALRTPEAETTDALTAPEAEITDALTAPEAETTDALTAPEAEITDALTPPEAEITDALTAPETEITDALTAPEAETTDALRTPEAETTDALTAPETEITDALTPPEAEITDALTAPETEITDALTAPEAETTDALTAPEAEITDALTAPEAETTDALRTPEAETTDALTTPEAEITDALTAPEAEITDALTAPEAEITDALTTPEAETTDALTTPEAETTDTLTAPEAEITDALTTPETEITDALTTPETETTEALTTPEAETTDALAAPEAEITDALTTPEAETTDALRTPVDSGNVPKKKGFLIVKIIEENMSKTDVEPLESLIQEMVLYSECGDKVESSAAEVTEGGFDEDTDGKRSQTHVVVVKITEEIQDSVHKTNAINHNEEAGHMEAILRSEDENTSGKSGRTSTSCDQKEPGFNVTAAQQLDVQSVHAKSPHTSKENMTLPCDQNDYNVEMKNPNVKKGFELSPKPYAVDSVPNLDSANNVTIKSHEISEIPIGNVDYLKVERVSAGPENINLTSTSPDQTESGFKVATSASETAQQPDVPSVPISKEKSKGISVMREFQESTNVPNLVKNDIERSKREAVEAQKSEGRPKIAADLTLSEEEKVSESPAKELLKSEASKVPELWTKTNTENEESIDLTSKPCDQKDFKVETEDKNVGKSIGLSPKPNAETAKDIIFIPKLDSYANDLIKKHLEKSEIQMDKVENLEVERVSVSPAQETEFLAKTDTEKEIVDLTSCDQKEVTTAQQPDVQSVHAKSLHTSSENVISSCDQKDFIADMKDVGKGFDLSPKLQAVEEGMNSSQDQRPRGVPEVEEIFNSGGSFDNKTQDSQNDPGPEILTKTDHVLTEEAEDMSEDGIEPKITQTDQDSDKYHLKGSKTNEVTQEERESNEPKMLTGFPDYELLSSLSSDFRISTLQFEHNTEYPPNMELEEEFLRLNEGAFCPQDMEEFDDQMDLSLELDMDEDLTEANVRVRPVERYVLIESPPFSDGFSEETRALCESFETIVKDDGGVPIGSNVREVSGFVDVVMSEEQDSGSILRNDGKENVEESGEEWEGEKFRVKDVDNWIQGSLGSASERKEKGLSREECGGSLEGVTTGGNTTKRDGFSQRASVMVEQHADGSQTGSISTEAAQKAQTQVPRSEGSLEIPPTPPASEWRVYGRSSGRISASPPSNQDPSVAKTQGWGLCTKKDLSLTKSNVLAVRSEDSKITFAEEKVKTVESSVSLQSTKVSGVVSTDPESDSTQRALSPGRFARADSGEWRVYGHNRDLQSSVPRVLSPTGRPTSPVPMAASPSRFGKGGSGEWRVYGQSQDRQSYVLSQTARLTSPTPTSPVEMGRFAGAGSGEYFGKNSDWTRLRSPTGRPTSPVPTEMSPVETGRFGKADSGEWLLYGYNRERMSSGLQTLSPTGRPTSPVPSPTSLVERGRFAWAGSEEYFGYGKSSNRMSSGPRVMRPTGRPTSPVPMATSPVETGRFARADSGEWRVYGHNRDRQSSGSRVSPTGQPTSPVPAVTSPVEMGRFARADSGEWRVYGHNRDRQSSGSRVSPTGQPTSPVPGVTSPVEMGRFARADSGEWRVYGTNRERMSHADQEDLLFDSRALSPTQSLSPDGNHRELCFSPPPLSPYGRFSPRTLSPDGSDGPRSLSPEWMVYRSLSPRRFDETQMLADSVNNAKNATTSHASADQLGRWATKDWLVYKSSGGADEKLRKRTLSPPQVQTKQFYVRGKEGTAKGGVAKTAMVKADNTSGKSSGKVGRGLVGSIGKLVSADWRRNKGSKVGVASGGRVISSSDGPIGSSGSGTSTKKERISVCKMAAALSKEKKKSTAPPAVQPGSTSHRSQL